MYKRLFLSIPLPDDLIKVLLDVRGQFNVQMACSFGLRWTKEENLHITVYFFGDAAEDKISELSARLRAVARGRRDFKMRFSQLEYAPPGASAPSMIWAVFAANQEYKQLTMSVARIAEQFLRIRPGRKEAIPHATLARFRAPRVIDGAARQDLSRANQFLSVQDNQEFVAGKCKLMASDLTPQGPIYTILEEFQLRP